MTNQRLVVVTATTNQTRFDHFTTSLELLGSTDVPVVVVKQKTHAELAVRTGVIVASPDYLGVVPAFAQGVQAALRMYPQAEVIACLHDDVLMEEPNWDEKLLSHFDRFPSCGLAGFGGAWGLGDVEAGKGEYRPTWLVRRGFMSNMPDAEVHGERSTTTQQVAVLDGFSLCFRAQFLRGYTPYSPTPGHPSGVATRRQGRLGTADTLFSVLEQWGVVHHCYDAAMGAFAKQLGWETWYLPFACQHLGGQTAVGDAGYAEWAKTQRPDDAHESGSGDQVFWNEAHKIVWQKLGHLLPFTVGDHR